MHLCAVSCTCGLQDAVIALIQPTSILDPSSGVHCFRCPNGKSAGTTHAIKCSTKPVISDKTCRLEPGLLTRKTSRRFWGWACKITKAIDESCNLESGWRQPSFYSHLNCKLLLQPSSLKSQQRPSLSHHGGLHNNEGPENYFLFRVYL